MAHTYIVFQPVHSVPTTLFIAYLTYCSIWTYCSILYDQTLLTCGRYAKEVITICAHLLVKVGIRIYCTYEIVLYIHTSDNTHM